MHLKIFFTELLQLISTLPAKRKVQFFKLLILMMAASISEIISIGAVLPFLSVLINPYLIFENKNISILIKLLEINNANDLILIFSIIFGLAALISGVIRVWMLKYSLHLSFKIGADLSNLVYRRSLYQPYDIHLTTHSSEIISGLSTKINNIIYMIILPCLNFISSLTLGVIIFSALVYINPIMAICSATVFGGLYLIISQLTRSRNKENSNIISRGSTALIKIMQEGLGSIRYIIINGTQEENCKKYKLMDKKLRDAQENNAFISTFPKYAIESIGLFLLCMIAYGMTKFAANLQESLPLLGALALGAQRILPAMQQVYASYSTIIGGRDTLRDIIILTNVNFNESNLNINFASLSFESHIELRKVTYKYPENKFPVINDITLKIRKYQTIGIIGSTGSGKSTLIDLISGLLTPTSGLILVDDVPLDSGRIDLWRQRIAHVPQHTFLADTSIAENIAFGIDKAEIDMVQVKNAAELAAIATEIEGWPEGYLTRVGENGALLSGGQRQRISIARALYKRSDFIVLDEATSAMDPDTESALTQTLKNIGERATIILIAHRLSSLSICDKIIELQDGKIFRILNYIELASRKV